MVLSAIEKNLAERFYHAIFPPALGMVEIIADKRGQLLKAGLIYRCFSLRQIFTLAPIGQGVRVIEEHGPFPATTVIQEGDHCPFVVIGQSR